MKECATAWGYSIKSASGLVVELQEIDPRVKKVHYKLQNEKQQTPCLVENRGAFRSTVLLSEVTCRHCIQAVELMSIAKTYGSAIAKHHAFARRWRFPAFIKQWKEWK
jgi:hypothetical protein